jgi:hypothetical protein
VTLGYDHPPDHIGDRAADDRARIDSKYDREHAYDGGVDTEIFSQPATDAGDVTISN